MRREFLSPADARGMSSNASSGDEGRGRGLLAAVVWLSFVLASSAEPNLAFLVAGSEFHFDTGALRGTLRAQGKSQGLTAVADVASGAPVSRFMGCFSHYRLLSSDARYGEAGWTWASTAALTPDGGVEVQWAQDAEHPFSMRAVYRWATSNALDLTTTVIAGKDLHKFEVFLSSYFEGFPAAFGYAMASNQNGITAESQRPQSEASSALSASPRCNPPQDGVFVEATKAMGDWLAFVRDDGASALIADGRWQRPPHPVTFKPVARYAGALAMRRDAKSGLTALVMAPPADCFAMLMPYGEESHRSLYLSLFGRDLKPGESATARARLVISHGLSDGETIRLYDGYLKEAMKDGKDVCCVKANAGAGKKVLIVTGRDLHDWRQTTPVLTAALAADPRMEISVVEDAGYLGSPGLKQYDAIVLHYQNWQVPDPGADALANLVKCVEEGRGLVLVHFACGAFIDWPTKTVRREFLPVAGRVWNPALRGHDPRGPFRVRVTDPGHPITSGLADFDTDDELYTCLAGGTPIRVLAAATSKVDHKEYPMAFVLTPGKGRTFHCVLGHDVKAFASGAVGQLFRRGTAWAAGLEPEGKGTVQ